MNVEPPSGQAAKPSFLSRVTATLVAHRKTLIVLPLISGVVCVLVLFAIRNRYSASVALVPEVRSSTTTGQLASLVALAGVSVPATSTSQSPQFYATILQGRPIRYAVLKRRYPAAAFGLQDRDSVALDEVLVHDEPNVARRLWLAADALEDATQVSTDIRTGIVRLSVTLRWREAVATVASAFAEELNHFNQDKRQSQARARRVFIEERVREADASLKTAEEGVRQFLLDNREYRGSATLQFEYQRLERALSVQQELFLELRRQLDAARIAEVDDLPAITQVESPVLPERKSGPRRAYWLASVLVLSTLATASWLVIRDHHQALLPGVAEGLAPLAVAMRRFLPRRN